MLSLTMRRGGREITPTRYAYEWNQAEEERTCRLVIREGMPEEVVYTLTARLPVQAWRDLQTLLAYPEVAATLREWATGE